jgi:hypothetical protein
VGGFVAVGGFAVLGAFRAAGRFGHENEGYGSGTERAAMVRSSSISDPRSPDRRCPTGLSSQRAIQRMAAGSCVDLSSQRAEKARRALFCPPGEQKGAGEKPMRWTVP